MPSFPKRECQGYRKSVKWKDCKHMQLVCPIKLSIHFGEDKTKFILFASQGKMKTFQKLEIIYNIFWIKQHSWATYLGCILEETMYGESMANKVISKVNTRLKFYIEEINI